MFLSRYMPCPDCGASVEQSAAADHSCDDERKLDYDVFRLRDEVASFEGELATFLESPRGRFELWYAGRDRRRQPPAD